MRGCSILLPRSAPLRLAALQPRSPTPAPPPRCAALQDRVEDALYDCDRALEANPRYVKATARRCAVLEKLEKLDEAAADAELWLAADPRSVAARDAIARIKLATSARDEKLKGEMLGKLKDMGNWVLGKFGLSVDNFKAVQDPATGSYSISFQQ